MTGIRALRIASVGACSETARFTETGSRANLRISGTSPTVETVTWRLARLIPLWSQSMAIAAHTAA
ncbi:hypothetical protein D3C87_1671200 [compost metagenome]